MEGFKRILEVNVTCDSLGLWNPETETLCSGEGNVFSYLLISSIHLNIVVLRTRDRMKNIHVSEKRESR